MIASTNPPSNTQRSRLPPQGLYAITPAWRDHTHLCNATHQALAAGISLLQYRGKGVPSTMQYQQARALAQLCRAHNVPLVINDDVALCLAVGADGVHLGRDDDDIASARTRLGTNAVIGVSCYNKWERAQAAAAAGASYLAFGACFPSVTKPAAVYCPPNLLQRARTLALPIVAIGGITVENGASLIAAGADFLAVISDLYQAPDIAQRVSQYRALFTANEI